MVDEMTDMPEDYEAREAARILEDMEHEKSVCFYDHRQNRYSMSIPQKHLGIMMELLDRRANIRNHGKLKLNDRVTKIKGSSWTGRIAGFYSTKLTPIGYAVESELEKGSVQIYPEAALALAKEDG